jgi:ATP-dependent DNA helicase RecG
MLTPGIFHELWTKLGSADESGMIEAKQASDAGKSCWETISAFANEPDARGGFLLLGIATKSDSLFPDYEIVGIQNPDKLQTDIATQCRDNFSSVIRPEFLTETVNGKIAMVVFIPEANPHDKPVYIKAKGAVRGAYRRIGSTDQQCTDDDIALFYQSRGHRSFDETVIDDTSLEDVDQRAVAAYRESRTRSGDSTASDFLRFSDDELLYALNATVRDRRTTRLTIAGLMLFGRQSAIRRHMPMTRIDYIRIDGREWISDPEKRYQSIEKTGPLFLVIPQLISQICDDIPKTFNIRDGGAFRQDVPLVPQLVVREAVVNALMHRSYRNNQPVQIIRYSNRIEIKNPGYSLVPQDRLGEPGSRPRNPKIAAALHDGGLAETKGTGIRAMRQAMEQANLTAPIIESDRVRDEFTLGLLVHHLLGHDDVRWLRGFKDCGLCPEDTRALVLIREIGYIDNTIYREVNKVDALTASRRLCNLRDLGLLTQHGKGSLTRYTPGERFSNPRSQKASRTGKRQPLRPEFPMPLRPEFESLRPELEALRRELPESLAVLINALGRRSTQSEIQEVIWDLCNWRALSLWELAALVNREPEHLQKRTIRPMIRDARMRYVHPAQPNHPNQKYVASVEGGEGAGSK